MPTPDPSNTNRLKAQDVRQELEDRDPADNPFLMDLAFDDEEIHAAMRRMAMRYNAIAPYVNSIEPDQIPAGDYTYLAGTVACLLRSRIQKIRRNNVAYNAGNMQVDPHAQRIEYMERWQEMYDREFMQNAKQRKLSINTNRAFGAM